MNVSRKGHNAWLKAVLINIGVFNARCRTAAMQGTHHVVVQSKKRRREAKDGLVWFKVPQLNFEASDYTELINWPDEVTESPEIMNISDAELKASIAEKETPSLFFSRFTCHTQAVDVALNL